MKRISPKVGFTLVELLLVTVLLAVVSLVVYGTFAKSFSIWRRISEPTAVENVGLFFRNISFDLHNTFKMTGRRFRGETREVTFPVRTRYRDKTGMVESIDQVTYEFDPVQHALYKSQATYSEVYRKKKGSRRLLADDIGSVRFEYYVYDARDESYSWVTSWQERDVSLGAQREENLPLLVKIEAGFPEEQGGHTFVKTVFVPPACCWPMMEEDKK